MKANRVGGITFGSWYNTEIPSFMKGMLKSTTSFLAEVMVRSAKAMSTSPLTTSPTIPVQRPGVTSFP